MNIQTTALATTAAGHAAAAITNDYGWPDTPWLEWKLLTGEQIDALDRETTVVLVSCSPIEVHGPHLPTCSDFVEADGITFRSAQLLKKKHPELTFVHLPPIWVGAQCIPHVGSLEFCPKTIIKVLTDLGRTLCKQGFKNIWVGSFHGGPRHFVAIEAAAHKVNKKYGGNMLSMFSLLMNQLTGGSTELADLLGGKTDRTREQLAGDTHGGTVETSLLLHLTGKHVHPVYKDLERNTVTKELARVGEEPVTMNANAGLFESLRSFKWRLRFFEDYTYAGDPAISDADYGEEILDVLAGLSVEPLSQVYKQTLPKKKWHSPLWKVRFMFLWNWLNWLFERIAGRKDNPTW